MAGQALCRRVEGLGRTIIGVDRGKVESLEGLMKGWMRIETS